MKSVAVVCALAGMLWASAAPAYTDARDLPLLKPDNHIGIVTAFEELPPDIQAKVDQYWDAALAKGMSVARIHQDWVTLEPQPGQYSKTLLEQQLKTLEKDGLQIMLTITTLDTGSLSLPPYIQDPEDDTSLVDGMNIDDPKVLERFRALLDWVVPMLVEHGGWVLSVANEPDTLFEDHPEYAQGMASFVAAARKHVRTINADLAVTATLAGHAFRPGGDWAAPIIAECDVASYNYYPLSVEQDWHVDGEFNLDKYVADMVRVADGRPFIIQEWGCPAGYEDKPSVMDASLEKQRRFFEETAKVMTVEPKFRAAFVFQMVDWSPQLTDWCVKDLVGSAEPGGFGQILEEWLLTTGLCRYQDGSPRPAWNEFLKVVERLSKKRKEVMTEAVQSKGE